MKKYIFLTLMLLALPTFGQAARSTLDSVQTLVPTDLFSVQTNSGGSFLAQQMSWRLLRSNMTSYMLGLSNAWTGINTFNGATFASGSHGLVTFADSTLFTASGYASSFFPRTNEGYSLGSYAQRWLNVNGKYGRFDQLYIYNAAGDDSVSVSYDEDNDAVSFSKLIVTQEVKIDSGASLNSLILSTQTYTPGDVADTVITLTSGESLVQLQLPGNLSTGISNITLFNMRPGQVFMFVNISSSYTIKFNNYVGNDDNLRLSGDHTMGRWDMLTVICTGTAESPFLTEISYSDN